MFASDQATLTLQEPADRILLVTLNRPEVANATNPVMSRELLALFEALGAHPSRYRCVVLTGAGEKAFCAGGDLKERNNQSEADWQAHHRVSERRVRAMLDCQVPIIAAVNGAAYGGGCEIALCCDFIYAAPGARFALSEVKLGIMPGTGGTQNLSRAVGERRAKELILTAQPFTAEEAQAWGMVNRIVEREALVETAVETAQHIADNAPIAVRQAKQSIQYGMRMDLHSGLMFEIEAYHRLIQTQDRLEGVRAFNEKRKPQFGDR